MPSLATLRQALSDVVQAAVPALHCSAYAEPSPNPPAMNVLPVAPIGQTDTFSGSERQYFDLLVMVVLEDWPRAQRQLDDYVGQVVAAIEARPDLGIGVACMVEGIREIPAVVSTSPRLYGVPVRVVVLT